MVAEPSRGGVWGTRVVIFSGFAAGLGLLLAATQSDDPPEWWWVVGGFLTVVFGALTAVWLAIRVRYPTTEDRERAIASMAAKQAELAPALERPSIAHRATKHRKEVLRDGVDGTAVVLFLADGQRGNEFHSLVYLELEVTVDGESSPFEVKTGEYVTAASAGSVRPGTELVVKVDPADRTRVAVDWERSLRLR
jgi:hypothetical protein